MLQEATKALNSAFNNSFIKKLSLYLHDCVREEVKSSTFRNLKGDKDNKWIFLKEQESLLTQGLEYLKLDGSNPNLTELMLQGVSSARDKYLIYGYMFLVGRNGKSRRQNEFLTPLLYVPCKLERNGVNINCILQDDVLSLNTGALAALLKKGEDDDALVFDNLIYGIMLNQIRKGKGLKRYQTVIQKRGNILLEKKMTIPAVKSKADELKMIVQDEYWDKASIMELERMRKSIRDLMKFAKSEGEAIHYTEFEDTWTECTEGVEFDNSEDFEDYEKKVNSYLTTHADTLPIYKLCHNQPLTAGDYEMLSKIFTEELGTQEDYDRTFQDTPLGKLVRRIVKMDHDATMQLFSEYIDEHKWNSQQIAFVRNLIAYVEEHGYIDDMSILLKPPFDRPMPFVRLYSPEDQKRIISIVNDINENATRLVG